MYFEKNFTQDQDYINSLKNETYVFEKEEIFDKEYAKTLFENALIDEFIKVKQDEDQYIKQLKLIRICDEIGFKELSSVFMKKMNQC